MKVKPKELVVKRADVMDQKEETKVLVPGMVGEEGQGIGEAVVQVEEVVVAPVSDQEEAQARWQRGAGMAWRWGCSGLLWEL